MTTWLGTVYPVVYKILVSAPQNPKSEPKQFDPLPFNIMLGYMSSRISGNTGLLDDSY